MEVNLTCNIHIKFSDIPFCRHYVLNVSLSISYFHYFFLVATLIAFPRLSDLRSFLLFLRAAHALPFLPGHMLSWAVNIWTYLLHLIFLHMILVFCHRTHSNPLVFEPFFWIFV